MLYQKVYRRLFIMKKRFISGSTGSPIKSVLIGTLAIILSFFILSLIFTVIAYSTDDPTSKSPLFSVLAFVLSGGIGAAVNVKLMGVDVGARTLLPSVISLVLFLIISAGCSGGISGGSLMSALIFSLVTIFALFLAGRKKRAKNFLRHRR